MAQQPTVDNLATILGQTLSPDPNVRKPAEKQLDAAKTLPGHPLQILQIVASNDQKYAIVRQAAAVHFKNIVKNGWDTEDDSSNINIPPSDREIIKSNVVELMCTVPRQIQSQCSEAISIIASYDFPKKWDNLLPDLIGKFNSPDPTIVQGVLLTASSIIKRFRYCQRSDALYADIIYVLERLQEPLLVLFKQMSQQIGSLCNDAALLLPRFESMRLMCRIFFSLNWQDLPEYFEDHMGEWMEEFAKYLQYTNPVLVDDDEELEPSPIDRLQCAIIENLNHYANKDEEAFFVFLPNFTSLVWNLLLNVSTYPKHDRLAAIGIKFLAGLVDKVMHRDLFKEEATLRQIIAKIVIPNMTIRETDEEKFEDDPQDFILSDIEGSESESRRRCSQDLLKAMCRQFDAQSTAFCLEHIQTMLAEFQANPAQNWAKKDVAIHLMLGISIKKESPLGVSEINPSANLLPFFTSHVLTELQSSSSSPSVPMLKATSLKFVTTFRNQFSKDNWNALMPLLISHLSSESIVVHSYAANAIEKVFLIKQGDKKIFGRVEVQPFLEPLFTGLFGIIDNVTYNENPHVMKCTMRCLSVSKEDIIPVTQTVLDKLTEALARVAKNPRDPQFNHYLFESIAVLIQSVCKQDPNYTSAFESLLFPPFQTILQADISEFTPYVFQLFAQILEFRPKASGLGDSYSMILPALLTPALWERKSNVPALSRLLCAYLSNSPDAVVPLLQGLLGVFQKLVSSKANEQSAFELLESVVIHMQRQAWEIHLVSIFQILLMRLQKAKTARLTRLLTRFFSLLIGKFGSDIYIDTINKIQPGLALNLIHQVWLPRLTSDAPIRTEAKIQVIGLTKLTCDTPALLSDPKGQQIWGQILTAIMKIILSPEYQQGFGTVTNDDSTIDVEIGYDAAYSKLHFASKPLVDPFAEVPNAALSFVAALSGLCQSQPGRFPPMIQGVLGGEPKLRAGLESLAGQAGRSLM